MPVICPECDTPLDLDPDDVEAGETVECRECGTDLEITSTDPLEIVPVEQEGYHEEDDHRHDNEDEEEDE